MRRGLFLLALLCAVSAEAHDFWIEPASFRPDAGSLVAIHLRVGENFIGEAVARDSELIERFALVTANGETRVAGREGADSAGIVRIAEPGIVVYRSRGTVLELTREKFEQFVDMEGLQWIRTERARRGETNAPWRESFSRCAKALIGSGTAALFTKPVGLRLELIPQANPSPGKALPVRLAFERRPVRNALVIAINAADPSQRIERRTDAQGRATLPLARGGRWLIKSVHVVRAPAGSRADWESLWASLTFDLR